MPRRREVPKRRIIPDPKYKDKLVSKFTNTLMFDGKKAVAENMAPSPVPSLECLLSIRQAEPSRQISNTSSTRCFRCSQGA